MNRRKAEWGNIYFWFWMFLFIFISKKDWNNLRYAHFRALLLVEILEQPIRMLKNEDRVIVRWNWFQTSTQGLILYRLCCKFCIGPALGHLRFFLLFEPFEAALSSANFKTAQFLQNHFDQWMRLGVQKRPETEFFAENFQWEPVWPDWAIFESSW